MLISPLVEGERRLSTDIILTFSSRKMSKCQLEDKWERTTDMLQYQQNKYSGFFIRVIISRLVVLSSYFLEKKTFLEWLWKDGMACMVHFHHVLWGVAQYFLSIPRCHIMHDTRGFQVEDVVCDPLIKCTSRKIWILLLISYSNFSFLKNSLLLFPLSVR